MLTLVAAILVLLLLSAFCSGAETALTAASAPAMQQLEQKGSKPAAIVNRLHARKERLIGALRLGNNAANILAAALAASALIELFGKAGVAYAAVAMTLLILVFAEILPKAYAFQNATGVALRIAPAVRALVFVLAPVATGLEVAVAAVLRLFGVATEPGQAYRTNPEELRGAIALHAGAGEEIEHERAMLDSVLDLSEVWVSEIMTHRSDMMTVDADLPAAEIVDRVLASPFTRFPLWRGTPDEVVGLLHAKALLRAVRGHGANLDDLDIEALAARPWFIPESTTLLDQLQAFRERREHVALVVDEYGVLLGLVTLEDILEEIVGEISDEIDVAVPGVRAQPDGSYLVQGTVTLRELNRKLGWSLPDEDVATVAGLVLHESRRIPEVGQTFRFHDFRFEIVRRHRHRIALVRIAPPLPG